MGSETKRYNWKLGPWGMDGPTLLESSLKGTAAVPPPLADGEGQGNGKHWGIAENSLQVDGFT